MMSRAPLAFDTEDLAKLSRQLGMEAAYAQGGGGNTSLKIDSRCMWIKASGTQLAQAQANTSFVPVDYTAICAGLSICKTEEDYTALVHKSIIELQHTTDLRPSIETGFHAFLGPVVLHSHSVWSNILACANEGAIMAQQILPEAAWIPYASPGLSITSAIAARRDIISSHSILILQNHGLVISSTAPDLAWDIQQSITTRIQQHFSLPPTYPQDTATYTADLDHMLFPDQAIYLGHETLEVSSSGKATKQAYDFLRNWIDKLGLTPHFLPAEESTFLLAMEAEKYRQKIAAS